MSRYLAGLLVWMCMAAMVPAGQAFEASITNDTAPLQPQTETGTITLVVEMTCDDLATAGYYPPLHDVGELHVQVDAPVDVVVTGPATIQFTSCTGLDPVIVEQDYAVAIASTAPGLTPLPITMRATLGEGTAPLPLGGTTEGEAETTVQAAPFVLLQVRVDQPVQGGEEDLRFPVTLVNLGNTAIDVTFSIADVNGPIGLWEPKIPAPLTIGAPGGGEAAADVEIVIERLGTRGSGQTVFRYAVAAQAPDGTPGPPVFVNVLARATLAPTNESTPGPPVAAVAMLVGAGAWAARRRL